MKWIRTDSQLPPAGEDVLMLLGKARVSDSEVNMLVLYSRRRPRRPFFCRQPHLVRYKRRRFVYPRGADPLGNPSNCRRRT